MSGMADTTSTASALGALFAQALAARDADALRSVLHPDVDFRGLTPNRFWEAHDRDAVLDIVFGVWFAPHDELEELVLLESDAFADREQVRFRLSVSGLACQARDRLDGWDLREGRGGVRPVGDVVMVRAGARAYLGPRSGRAAGR